MSRLTELETELRARPRRWAVTGVAGFIGSNLLEALLRLDQTVIGLDSFATGNPRNLESVRAAVGEARWARFRFTEADIAHPSACAQWLAGGPVDHLLHQAALGSVPRSLADPAATHRANVDGFLHVLLAAREAGIRRLVYASSSSVYGDHPALPKVETNIGRPLSPYALTKLIDEQYAAVFAHSFGFGSIGLRYFNVFGPRQNPAGAYSAVIPKWIGQMLRGEAVTINGDGETSRDFCYIENVVQANLLAATAERSDAVNQVYNIAAHSRTTLIELHGKLAALIQASTGREIPAPLHQDFRAGDVRHALAAIDKAADLLGYVPAISVDAGLRLTVEWYLANRTP